MATVHNPTTFSLFCAALGRSLDAGATVAVSDAVAATVGTNVFEVTRDAHKPVPEAAVERKVVRRGSKAAEVSGPPKKETR